jgi:hypothetical protein
MKWLDCIPFVPFTSSSWWVHVGVISLICADGGATEKKDGSRYQAKETDMPIRKRKWFIPVVVAVSVLLIGGITGGMIAAADNGLSGTVAQNQTSDRYQALLDRACAIYQENTGVAIDPGQLKAALQQAESEMRGQALKNRLQDLVDRGKITQQEADQYLDWWQSRPDIQVPLPGLGGSGLRGGMMWGKGFELWGAPCPGPDASGEAAG